ncbi:hypothetical protein V1505DRAFT_357887 [Lipomyces doorenjongii]
MSATSTSSATEKVNGTALADVVEGPEGKGDAEQAKEPVDTADDVGVYPKGFRLAMVVLALVLAVFLVALDLKRRSLLQLYLASQTNSTAWIRLGVLLGKVYKFFPVKLSFRTAIAIFELGSLICGVSQNSNMLIAGRAIAGLGAAGISTG